MWGMRNGIVGILAVISLGWGSVATAGAENGGHHGNPGTTASAHMSDQGRSNRTRNGPAARQKARTGLI